MSFVQQKYNGEEQLTALRNEESLTEKEILTSSLEE